MNKISPIKVLMVDDDLRTLEMIAAAMEDEGFRVRSMNSVKDLMEIIPLFEPSIIVLDIEIGKDNGLNAAREIKCSYPHIPILFISSHTEKDIMHRGIQQGEVYVKKPFEIYELEEYIRKYAIMQPQNMYLLSLGDFTFNRNTRELLYKGNTYTKLSPVESDVFSILYDNLNKIVSYDTLASKIWEKPFKEVDAQIYNVLSKLRKLFTSSQAINIVTCKGEGVKLEYKK